MGLIVPREAFAALRESLPDACFVFTNGCFDLVHPGHVTLLNFAAGLGDALVVGLNSDASVQRLKGPTRPILPEQERARMLASLPCVSFVIIYDETQAVETIRVVRPRFYVKGGDYRKEEIPEVAVVEELGGEVVLAPQVPGCSTTRIIEEMARKAGA